MTGIDLILTLGPNPIKAMHVYIHLCACPIPLGLILYNIKCDGQTEAYFRW